MVFISTVVALRILSMRSAYLRPHVHSGENLKFLFSVSVEISQRFTKAHCVVPGGVPLLNTPVSGLPKAENQSGTLLFAN